MEVLDKGGCKPAEVFSALLQSSHDRARLTWAIYAHDRRIELGSPLLTLEVTGMGLNGETGMRSKRGQGLANKEGLAKESRSPVSVEFGKSDENVI